MFTDMEFVQNFTPPDFQAKDFTPSISPNFNSFSKKKHKKIVKIEKFTPLATNFTLPPGLTGWTNSTSACIVGKLTHYIRGVGAYVQRRPILLIIYDRRES